MQDINASVGVEEGRRGSEWKLARSEWASNKVLVASESGGIGGCVGARGVVRALGSSKQQASKGRAFRPESPLVEESEVGPRCAVQAPLDRVACSAQVSFARFRPAAPLARQTVRHCSRPR